jgi:Serpin (serine protease inhibitor)
MMNIKVKLRRLFSGQQKTELTPTVLHERSQPSGEEWFSDSHEQDNQLTFPDQQSQRSAEEFFGDENNDFALAMYEQLRQQPGNLFFSPFSIRSALSMIEAGARGETAAQMRQALRISYSADMPRSGLADIVQRLKLANYGKYEMTVANSLWPRMAHRYCLDLST